MWFQYLIICFILALIILGLFKFKLIIQFAGMEAFGFFIGFSYFVFFPLIAMSKLQVIENYVPSFPEIAFPLVVLLIYLLETYAVFVFRKPKMKKQHRINLNREEEIYWFSILLYFSIQLFLLFGSGVLEGGHWYHTRGEFLRRGGSGITILLFVIWGMRLLIVAYTFQLLYFKRITLLNAGLVTIAITLYEFLYVGNRIVILMFGIVGFYYIYRRYGKKILTLLIAILAPIMVSLGVYQDVRSLLFQVNHLEFIRILIQEMAKQNLLLSFAKVCESADLLIMLDLFSRVNQNIEPIYGSSFLKVITWMIPRSLWTLKPLSITEQVGNVYLPGKGVSLVPLFFGEVHYNFGTWGLIIYPIILWLLLDILEYLGNKIGLNNYLKFLLGFLAFRLPVSDMIVSAIILVIVYKSMTHLWRYFPKKMTLSSVQLMGKK